MKTYPSIPTKWVKDQVFVAFDKLDGSNIRAEWSKKKGFYKFGSKTQLLDPNDPMLGPAIPLLNFKYGDTLPPIFEKQRWERVIAFFEYVGDNSFAGSHEKDDNHQLVLLDVNPYKKGILGPREFQDLFEKTGIPSVLYEGLLTEEFIDEVKQGLLNGMTFEGVVCKYIYKNQHMMFKIKNRTWIDKLRVKCKGNEKLFQRLV